MEIDNNTRKLYMQLSQRPLIAFGRVHYAALHLDGTVHANSCENRYGESDVERWSNIVAVSAGSNHTVGLKSDGTVVATDFKKDYCFEGTMLNNFYCGQCDVFDWTDVVTVAAGYSHTVALRKNGTVVSCGGLDDGECNTDNWENIVMISAGEHTVGLKSDCTVVACGNNKYGECNVSEWKSIIGIAAGADHTVGLRANGTVVAVGNNEYGQCDVSGWTDIVSVAAGLFHTVGLKSDGTVVAVGDNRSGELNNLSYWKDIVSIHTNCSSTTTMGIKKDGVVVVSGRPKEWLNSAEGIKLFQNISTLKQERKEAHEIWDRKRQYKAQGLCQNCGGKFKGLFSKVCTQCENKKDY